jgi:predicted transcriptional regulator
MIETVDDPTPHPSLGLTMDSEVMTLPVGLGTSLQATPSQRSATPLPAAQPSVGESMSIARKSASVGVGTGCQLCPSQCMIVPASPAAQASVSDSASMV